MVVELDTVDVVVEPVVVDVVIVVLVLVAVVKVPVPVVVVVVVDAVVLVSVAVVVELVPVSVVPVPVVVVGVPVVVVVMVVDETVVVVVVVDETVVVVEVAVVLVVDVVDVVHELQSSGHRSASGRSKTVTSQCCGAMLLNIVQFAGSYSPLHIPVVVVAVTVVVLVVWHPPFRLMIAPISVRTPPRSSASLSLLSGKASASKAILTATYSSQVARP